MKHTSFHILILIVFLSAASCEKVSESRTDMLPPTTTEGLNTFGCLMNGDIIVPQEPPGNLGSYYACQYEPFYADPNKAYRFNVWGRDQPDANNFKSVEVAFDSVTLHQGDIFQLGANRKGGKHGACSIASKNSYVTYTTTDTLIGQCTITFLDVTKGIVSGIFWFDAKSNLGDTVHIREGRFDMQL